MRQKWQSINNLETNELRELEQQQQEKNKNKKKNDDKSNFNRLKKSYNTMRKSFRLHSNNDNDNSTYATWQTNYDNDDIKSNLIGQFGIGAAKLLRSVYGKSRRIGNSQHELDSIYGSFKILSPSNNSNNFIPADRVAKKSDAELKIEQRIQRSKGKILPSASYVAPDCERACDGLNLEELEEIKRDNLRQTLIRSSPKTAAANEINTKTSSESKEVLNDDDELECLCNKKMITNLYNSIEEINKSKERNNNFCLCDSISSSFTSIYQYNNNDDDDNRKKSEQVSNEIKSDKTTRAESRASSVAYCGSLSSSSFKLLGTEIEGELKRMFDSLNDLNVCHQKHENVCGVLGLSRTEETTTDIIETLFENKEQDNNVEQEEEVENFHDDNRNIVESERAARNCCRLGGVKVSLSERISEQQVVSKSERYKQHSFNNYSIAQCSCNVNTSAGQHKQANVCCCKHSIYELANKRDSKEFESLEKYSTSSRGKHLIRNKTISNNHKCEIENTQNDALELNNDEDFSAQKKSKGNHKISCSVRNKNSFRKERKTIMSLVESSNWCEQEDNLTLERAPPLPPTNCHSDSSTDEHLYATIYGCSQTSSPETRRNQQHLISSMYNNNNNNNQVNCDQHNHDYGHRPNDHLGWQSKLEEGLYYERNSKNQPKLFEKQLMNNYEQLHSKQFNSKSTSEIKLNKPKKSFFSRIKHMIVSASTTTTHNNNNNKINISKTSTLPPITISNDNKHEQEFEWSPETIYGKQRTNKSWKKSATLSSRSTHNLIANYDNNFRANNNSLSRKSINSIYGRSFSNNNKFDNHDYDYESQSKSKSLVNGFLTLGRLRDKVKTKNGSSSCKNNQIIDMFQDDRRMKHLCQNGPHRIRRQTISNHRFSGSADSLPSADSGLSCSNLQHCSSSDENYAPIKSTGNLYSIAPNNYNELEDNKTNKIDNSSDNLENCVESERVFYEIVGKARAKVDCNPCAYDKEALVFKKGDIIDILERNESGTWFGRNGNQVGHFKFINVTEILYDDNKFSTEEEKAFQNADNKLTNYITKLEIKSQIDNQQEEGEEEQEKFISKRISQSMNTIDTSFANKDKDIENNNGNVVASSSSCFGESSNNNKSKQQLNNGYCVNNNNNNNNSSNETIMSSLEQLLFAIGLADEQVVVEKKYQLQDYNWQAKLVGKTTEPTSVKENELASITIDLPTPTSYLDVLSKGGINNLDSFSTINDLQVLEQIGIVDDEHQRRLLMAARIIRQASQAAKLDFVETTNGSNTTATTTRSTTYNQQQTTTTVNNEPTNRIATIRARCNDQEQNRVYITTKDKNNSNEPIYVNLAINAKSASVCDKSGTTDCFEQQAFVGSQNDSIVIDGKERINDLKRDQQILHDEKHEHLDKVNNEKKFYFPSEAHLKVLHMNKNNRYVVVPCKHSSTTSHAVGYIDRTRAANSINQSDHYHSCLDNTLPVNDNSRANHLNSDQYDDYYDVQEETVDLSSQLSDSLLARGYSVRFNDRTVRDRAYLPPGAQKANQTNNTMNLIQYNDLNSKRIDNYNYHNKRSSFDASNYSKNHDESHNYLQDKTFLANQQVVSSTPPKASIVNNFVLNDNNNYYYTTKSCKARKNGQLDKTNSVNSRSQINSKSAYDLRLDLSHFFS